MEYARYVQKLQHLTLQLKLENTCLLRSSTNCFPAQQHGNTFVARFRRLQQRR
jgi:hypothetical protein